MCVTAGAWAGYSFYRTFPAFTRLDLVLPSILLFLSLPNLIAIDSFTFHPIFFSIELSVVQFDRPFAQFYWLFFYELGKTFTEILTSRVLLISIGSYLILPVFAALRGRRTDKLDVVEKPKFLCFFFAFGRIFHEVYPVSAAASNFYDRPNEKERQNREKKWKRPWPAACERARFEKKTNSRAARHSGLFFLLFPIMTTVLFPLIAIGVGLRVFPDPVRFPVLFFFYSLTPELEFEILYLWHSSWNGKSWNRLPDLQFHDDAVVVWYVFIYLFLISVCGTRILFDFICFA